MQAIEGLRVDLTLANTQLIPLDNVGGVTLAVIVEDLDSDNVCLFSDPVGLSRCNSCHLSSVTIVIHHWEAPSCPAECCAAFKLLVIGVHSAVDNVNVDTITYGLGVRVGVTSLLSRPCRRQGFGC